MLSMLKEIQHLCVTTPAGYDKLMQARDLMLKHHEFEDRTFYPALENAALHNHKLKAMLQEFDEERKLVTALAHEFFEHYSIKHSDEKLLQDFGTFFILLTNRMNREERLLFTKYERFTPSKSHPDIVEH